MKKKVLSLLIGLGLALGASATITFPQSDIQYWVGSGSNSAVVVIAWDDYSTPTALAWGVHWNGTATALDLIDSIQTYDSRFSNGSSATVASATYTEGGVTISSPQNWWCYTVNGEWAMVGYTGYTMSNGDIMEISGSCDFSMTTAVAATDPNGSSSETPVEATIAAEDILYWVGEGSNQAILAVNWADTALAWGYRWNGTATVTTMMDAIAAADPRFSYTGTGYLDDIHFVCANGDTLSITPGNYWGSTNNGMMDGGMTQPLANNDFEKWADPAAGVIVDSFSYEYDTVTYVFYTYVYPMTIYPVSVPTPVEATIAASDILYWVGEGSNQAILAVNWADTALAWGYRWNGNATVNTMMDAIAAADPRFSYTGTGYVEDILFARAEGDTLRGQPYSYWESKNNGISDIGMGQALANNDFEKWAEPAAGVIVDSMIFEYDTNTYVYYTYVYPMTIYPVSVPDSTGVEPEPEPEHGPFCGVVGTEGCDAIAADSSVFKAWATGCTVTRGPWNIAVENSPAASYGADSMAIGPVSMTDNLTVVSLGDGGSALLTFATPIANGNGPDFAVFENSFNDYFLELAFVEVSSDGDRFVRFPATSLTQTQTQTNGTGSTDPTFINNLAGKYRLGYGTPFDLSDLADSTGINLDSIVYVRIVDVVGSIDPLYATYDAFGHMVNDPWPTNGNNCGFDLAGVGVINQYQPGDTTGISDVVMGVSAIYPNPTYGQLTITLQGEGSQQAMLYDATGRLAATLPLHGGINTVDMGNLPNGVYMLRVAGTIHKIVKR